MTAKLLEGAPVAEAVLADVAKRVEALSAAGKGVGLGTILVGADEASARYVARKHEACERVGMASRHVSIPGQPPARAICFSSFGESSRCTSKCRPKAYP